ncbi:MAG: ComF family protein [Beijerinckiaceae bacterium]|jgi:ComF family protein
MTFRAGFWPSAAIARLFRQLAASAVDLVFPRSCLACRKATEAQDALCPECWRSVRFIERPFCERLGTPFPVDLGAEGLLSPEAIANPPVYDRARAVAHFEDGPVRRLVHRLKYGDRLELARAMGAWMTRAGDELLTGADVLIPVPLHRGRLASRRFNQAAMLARVISEQSGVPVDAFSLTRIKPTPPQVGLTRSQRAANVQGAFRVPPQARLHIEGKAAVLIDDVMTSGATINAASRALLRAGAARVDVLVFARVVTG